MRTHLILLLSVLLIDSASIRAAYRPAPRMAHAPSTISRTDALRGSIVKTGVTRAERRLQKLLRRVRRALPYEGEGKFDRMSLVAMILGIAGLVSLAFFPVLIVLCVPALILGIIGLRHVKRDGTTGYGFAIAGIVTGALGILIALSVLVAAVVILSWFLK